MQSASGIFHCVVKNPQEPTNGDIPDIQQPFTSWYLTIIHQLDARPRKYGSFSPELSTRQITWPKTTPPFATPLGRIHAVATTPCQRRRQQTTFSHSATFTVSDITMNNSPQMEIPLTKVSPSYSHASCASNQAHADHGFIYDDYAREIPKANTVAARYSAMRPDKQQSRFGKIRSPLYIVVLLALVVFLVQLGASLSDVPSTRLLELLICNKYYGNSAGSLRPELKCDVSTVQGRLNILTTGSLVLGFLPGESHVGPVGNRI